MSRLFRAFALSAVLLGPAVAYAGDVKFGTEPLATNDAGKLTEEGKKAATEELASEPGEEVWPIHVWAQIDKGGPGPLYIEFWGKLPDGKPYLTYRHEHGDYAGEKYVSLSFELSGNLGFNKNKTYNVKVLQVSPKGKDIVLANGKVTLAYTEPEKDPEDEGDEEGKDEGGKEADSSADQDAIDTLAPAEGGDGGDGPPPIDGKKKGCSVHSEEIGVSSVLLLFAAGAIRLRRRSAAR